MIVQSNNNYFNNAYMTVRESLPSQEAISETFRGAMTALQQGASTCGRTLYNVFFIDIMDVDVSQVVESKHNKEVAFYAVIASGAVIGLIGMLIVPLSIMLSGPTFSFPLLMTSIVIGIFVHAASQPIAMSLDAETGITSQFAQIYQAYSQDTSLEALDPSARPRTMREYDTFCKERNRARRLQEEQVMNEREVRENWQQMALDSGYSEAAIERCKANTRSYNDRLTAQGSSQPYRGWLFNLGTRN